jgi:carbon monoxide dehydrogenase subunit G
MRISRTFSVGATPSDAVAYLADFTNAKEWDPGTQDCARLDSGPVAVGATWRNVSRVLGRQTELTYRLDRLEPDHITLVGTNKSATSTDDITVIGSDSGGSVITYTATIDLHGVASLATPLMKIEMERLGTETVKGITTALSRP